MGLTVNLQKIFVVLVAKTEAPGKYPGASNPLRPCASSYDLHEKAGGLPLSALAAPNIHLSSKRRREVCNQAEKSNIPIIKCGSKRTHHAPSRLKLLLVRIFFVELLHDQLIYGLQFLLIFDSAKNGFAVFLF